MVKERQREQEEAAPAEVFSSQATRCAKREIEREKKRGGVKEAAAAARFREREREHSRSQKRERKERKAESKRATSSSPKGPLLRLPFAFPRIT